MRICLLALLIALPAVMPLSLVAQEEEDTGQRMEAWADRVMERTKAWMDEHLEELERRRLADRRADKQATDEALESTLELSFAIGSEEENERVFVVTTATQHVQLLVEEHGEEGFQIVRIEGRVLPQSANGERIRLVHETMVEHGGEGGEHRFSLMGSCDLRLGQSHLLGAVGEQSLRVTARSQE